MTSLLPHSPLRVYVQQMLLGEERARAAGNRCGSLHRAAELARARQALSAVGDALLYVDLSGAPPHAPIVAAEAREGLLSAGCVISATVADLILAEARFQLGEDQPAPGQREGVADCGGASPRQTGSAPSALALPVAPLARAS
jgi:hypothetical protein